MRRQHSLTEVCSTCASRAEAAAVLVEPGRRLLRVMLSSTMHSLPLMATDLGYSLCRMHGCLETHIMCACYLQPRAVHRLY